jgi:predicted short-subunit dehydrogenase-like oxidoreductase (DUF2520 family)
MVRKKKTDGVKSLKTVMSKGLLDDSSLAAQPGVSVKKHKSVSVIGAGRLGTALAIALISKGYSIQTVVTRHIRTARQAARLIGPNTVALTSARLAELAPSHIILITTPDDAIEAVAAEVSTSVKWSGRRCIALHTSGALSSELLNSLRAIGFQTGSMHPLVSVSDSEHGAESLRLAQFCVEGQPQAVRVARSIVRAFGGKSFSIRTRDKALYHAAAVMSSGHMVALFDIVTELLMHCGLTKKQATSALLPLLTSTVENLAVSSTARSLTGTFARTDTETVRKHLAALVANGNADALEIYKLLGLRSLELARENGADLSNLEMIKRLLKKFPG